MPESTAPADGERRELGISELTAATGLPKSTVHRMASDLVECGMLVAIGSRYRVGIRLFELGSRWLPSNMKDLIDPYLKDLSGLTRGVVQGAILEFFRDGLVSRVTADKARVSKRRAEIPTLVGQR